MRPSSSRRFGLRAPLSQGKSAAIDVKAAGLTQLISTGLSNSTKLQLPQKVTSEYRPRLESLHRKRLRSLHLQIVCESASSVNCCNRWAPSKPVSECRATSLRAPSTSLQTMTQKTLGTRDRGRSP